MQTQNCKIALRRQIKLAFSLLIFLEYASWSRSSPINPNFILLKWISYCSWCLYIFIIYSKLTYYTDIYNDSVCLIKISIIGWGVCAACLVALGNDWIKVLLGTLQVSSGMLCIQVPLLGDANIIWTLRQDWAK